MRGIIFSAVLFGAGLFAVSTARAQNDLYYAAQPYGVYATRTYPPGYLPPRYYGGVGYWGGRGSSYYYGGGLRRSYRGR